MREFPPSFPVPSLLAHLLAAGCASLPVLSIAQTAPATDLGRIEIRSNRNNDTEVRRESTAAKIVIGREEIEKQGDATLGEVLKRLPGINVQGGALRMRGLGGAFTQILVNGEPAPPGFSVEQLNPAQVERIEVSKAPTAKGAKASPTLPPA